MSKPRRLLVVDDNADDAKALTGLLEGLGHMVESVADARAAIAAARRVKPSVVLLAVGKAGIDGDQLARRLKAELGARLRFVAITPGGSTEDALSADAGFDAHLHDPADLEAIDALFGTFDQRGD